ncbi:MAG: hypothetical protein COV91_00335, partial [Candidatus Taylorbacteria bacterium CG11_big_fil_rev_8_21_14_0_20_46_11]
MYEEEVIFGPFTLKQTITLALGAGLGYLTYIKVSAPMSYVIIGLTHFAFFCHSSESWNPVYSRF